MVLRLFATAGVLRRASSCREWLRTIYEGYVQVEERKRNEVDSGM
jgi:hypothetical protein